MKYVYIGLIIAISFTIGRYSGPAKVTTVEVERVVTVEKETTDTNKTEITNERETRSVDGTVIIERTIESKSQTVTESSTMSDSAKSSKSKSSNLPDNQVSVMYNLRPDISPYTVSYERRLFSSLYVGGFVTPGPNAAVGIKFTIGF